ncbi:P2Y purinoceptor 2 isoform X1 [Oncorhynchus kisutch]|uniref:P2Y purinoceptor 2-like n=1 Tax=Oncorhynchus kisutch TaxID=8019 RepID=A0A8C7ISK3_ONCKI|nr:P2Y purinoceptor 2-like isoform X1 [Oncorhynchus kisutch]
MLIAGIPHTSHPKMNSTVSPSVLPLDNRSLSESCTVEPQHVSITVFLLLVVLVGFFLNSFSLWVFCCRIPQWSSGTVLQFHLAVSDTVITPVAPLMATYFVMGSHWPFGAFLCKLKIALLSIHFYGSILFLTLISIHRYVVVVQFKRGSCMKRKAFVQNLCAGVWLVLLAKGIACFFLLNTSPMGNRTQCLSIHQEKYIDVYFAINFVMLIPGFLLPLSVAVTCYVQLARSMSRININMSKGRDIKAKSRKMVAMCLVIFALCFTPLNVIRTVAVILKKYFPEQCSLLLQVETAYYISWILAGANCCLDPLLYCFGSHNFVKAIHRSLRKFDVKFKEDPATNDQIIYDTAIDSPSIDLEDIHTQHSNTS